MHNFFFFCLLSDINFESFNNDLVKFDTDLLWLADFFKDFGDACDYVWIYYEFIRSDSLSIELYKSFKMKSFLKFLNENPVILDLSFWILSTIASESLLENTPGNLRRYEWSLSRLINPLLVVSIYTKSFVKSIPLLSGNIPIKE